MIHDRHVEPGGSPAGARAIGSRVASFTDRLSEPDFSERFAHRALAVAVIAYAALALWLTRGASFIIDELPYFAESAGLSPGALATPFGGHLTAVTRLFFEASLRLFGPEHLPFQLFVIALAATSAVLLFVLVRRRVGPLPALAAAVLLLFLGTTPEVLQANTTMWVQASAAGLAAFVALDRRSRYADALACVLLVAAVLSFEVGVAFAIAAGAWILADGDWRRLWVPAVPVVLYAGWWIWALKFDQGFTTATNVLLAPSYAADSLAAAAAALTGLGVDLSVEADLGTIPLGWGRIAAALAVALVVLGVRRSGFSALLWGVLGLLAALWVAGALSVGGVFSRVPNADRNAYPVVIGLVLVLAASLRGSAPSRRGLLLLLALVAFALPVNLWQMRERGALVRSVSDETQARLAMIELKRDIVPPQFIGTGVGRGPVFASAYLAAVDRFGGLGFTVAELEEKSASVRQQADRTLGAITLPRLVAHNGKGLGCIGADSEAELPPGGAVLRSDAGGELTLRRFADEPTIEAGALAPGVAGRLGLDLDDATQPWVASIAPPGELEICSANPAEGE